MLLFIGQIAGHAREREAFQEVNYKRFFGDIAKWVVEIDRAERIPELVTRAFAVATSGRPGPVVISLPEDMLTSEAEAPKALSATPVETSPGEAEMRRLHELLTNAKKPFAIFGGTRWSANRPNPKSREGREAWALPVGCSFRRQMLFDNLHPCYAGDVGIGPNPKLAAAVKEADLVFLIGGRFGEMPSSDYTLIKAPIRRKRWFTCMPTRTNSAGLPARVAINASPAAFARHLRKARRKPRRPGRRAPSNCTSPISTGRRRRSLAPARSTWVRSWPIWKPCCPTMRSDQRRRQLCHLAASLPSVSPFRHAGGANIGSMGYGTPGAVAAKILFPDREVICFAGDGCFPDARPGIRHRRAVPAYRSSFWSSTTASTARSACIRNANIPAASQARSAQSGFRRFGARLWRAWRTVEKTAEFAPAFERARTAANPRSSRSNSIRKPSRRRGR